MWACNAHAGECKLISTSEGTFCTLSGIELAGPALVCYNFESAGNRVYHKTSTTTKLRRSQHSISIKNRALKSVTKWKTCVSKLYPTLSASLMHSLSQALCAWSAKLELCKATHPAIKRWPMIFAATILSRMASGGAVDRNGSTLVPANAELAALELDHKLYKTFGVTCRSMSIAWRKVRTAALDESGVLISANAFPFDISTAPGNQLKQ